MSIIMRQEFYMWRIVTASNLIFMVIPIGSFALLTDWKIY